MLLPSTLTWANHIYYDKKIAKHGVIKMENEINKLLVTSEVLEDLYDTAYAIWKETSIDDIISRTTYIQLDDNGYQRSVGSDVFIFHNHSRGAIEFGGDFEWGDFNEETGELILDTQGENGELLKYQIGLPKKGDH